MAVFLWLLAALFGLLTVLDPAKVWSVTTAWQYRNPEANEPSEAAYVLGRIMTGVVTVVLVIAAIAATVRSVGPFDQGRVDALGRRVATELEGPYDKYFQPSEQRVIREVADAGGGSRVAVRAMPEEKRPGAGFEDDTHYTQAYVLTSTDDEDAHGCLTLEYYSGLFHEGDVDVETRYSPGGC